MNYTGEKRRTDFREGKGVSPSTTAHGTQLQGDSLLIRCLRPLQIYTKITKRTSTTLQSLHFPTCVCGKSNPRHRQFSFTDDGDFHIVAATDFTAACRRKGCLTYNLLAIDDVESAACLLYTTALEVIGYSRLLRCFGVCPLFGRQIEVVAVACFALLGVRNISDYFYSEKMSCDLYL